VLIFAVQTSSSDLPRALLLTKDKKVPLLWKVLGNKYKDQLVLGSHRDRKGKTSVAMGLEAGEKKQSKVLIYLRGSSTPVRYQGVNKLEHLTKFFDSVLDGSADLSTANEEAEKVSETYEPTEEEKEIERKQEEERIKLAHGGFAEFIDFEEALKDGKGRNFHDSHGFGDGMGDVPTKGKKEKRPDPEDAASSSAAAAASASTDEKAEATPPPEDTAQAAFEATPSPEEDEAASKATSSSTPEEVHPTDEL
jgi:protein disulfide-isomerase A6